MDFSWFSPACPIKSAASAGHVASRGAMEGARESHARGESISQKDTGRLSKAIAIIAVVSPGTI